MMIWKHGIAVLLISLGMVAPASGQALVFDSWNGTNSTSNRGAGDSPGSQISVSITTTISNIAVRNDLNSNGNLRFLIFEHPSHTLLFASTPKSFVDDGMSWKTSDDFSFTLEAGKTYDIGAIANVGGLWQFDGASASQNGFSSIVSNPNFLNFNSPILNGHAGADGAVQLFVPIPEPALGLLAGALVLGGVQRRWARSRANDHEPDPTQSR